MNTKGLVWLQGIGAIAGKKAEEIVVGDVLVWNYGYTSEVKAILGETSKTVTLQIEDGGKLFERKFKKDRYVGFSVNGKYKLYPYVTKDQV